MARNYKRDRRGRFSKVAGAKVKVGKTSAQKRARNQNIKRHLVTGAKIGLIGLAVVAQHQASKGRGSSKVRQPSPVAHTRTPSATPKRPAHKSPVRAPNGAIPMPAARVPNAGTAGKSVAPTFDELASAYSAQARHSARYNSPNPKVALEYASSAQYLKDIALMAKHRL